MSADTPLTAKRRAQSAPGQYHEITWCVCVCVCARARVCVCVCVHDDGTQGGDTQCSVRSRVCRDSLHLSHPGSAVSCYPRVQRGGACDALTGQPQGLKSTKGYNLPCSTIITPIARRRISTPSGNTVIGWFFVTGDPPAGPHRPCCSPLLSRGRLCHWGWSRSHTKTGPDHTQHRTSLRISDPMRSSRWCRGAPASQSSRPPSRGTASSPKVLEQQMSGTPSTSKPCRR